MDATQAEVKALLDRWSAAVNARDLDRLMLLYALDAVYYDVVPPLQITGAEAIRRNFQRWFESWQSAIGSERRELRIVASGDAATAHMLHRTSGTLKDGREVGYWVRVTVACERSNQRWFIKHEHVSLPVDVRSGRILMDQTP